MDQSIKAQRKKTAASRKTKPTQCCLTLNESISQFIQTYLQPKPGLASYAKLLQGHLLFKWHCAKIHEYNLPIKYTTQPTAEEQQDTCKGYKGAKRSLNVTIYNLKTHTQKHTKTCRDWSLENLNVTLFWTHAGVLVRPVPSIPAQPWSQGNRDMGRGR